MLSAGEPILSCSFKDFSSNVLGGNASLDIIYGSSEVGIATIYSTNKYHDREFPTGAGGEPYPGVEIKVLNKHDDYFELLYVLFYYTSVYIHK